MKPIIELKDVYKSFDGKKIISNHLSLAIEEGSFTAIIGRSGEGKSVLLKQMIGLIKPDSGHVFIEGEDITQLSESEFDHIFEKCGYVFQFAALLDSLNVFENVGITALEAGEEPKKVRREVAKKIKMVGLPADVINKYPSELSGGMRKRVGLARTLMRSPKILIYDEPTTGLDPISVRTTHELMKKTHDEIKATTIVISHDPDIFNYADTVAMLHEGKVIYTGPAKNIWKEKNPYIYQFVRGLSDGPITLPSKEK